MTCAQGLLRLLWGGGRSWSATGLCLLIKLISNLLLSLLLLLLFTRPLPRDGGMAEDHGAPEAGQLPKVWTRGRRETKSRQKVSGAKSP